MKKMMMTTALVLSMLLVGIPGVLAMWEDEPDTRQSGEESPLRIFATITNHYATTTIQRTYTNTADSAVDVNFKVEIPEEAFMSNLSLTMDGKTHYALVLPKEEARKIYGEEKDKGNDAGLAEKNSFYTFDLHVSPVRAQNETRVRFLYYQPIEIDTGMGRYLYPLEEGGTDEAALNYSILLPLILMKEIQVRQLCILWDMIL